LYDKFDEFGINTCVQNKTMLKCVKNHGNWFRRFEDVSRRYEPSSVVVPRFGAPCIAGLIQRVLTGGAVVDLAVPDAALTDDVPRLCRPSTCDDRLITGPGHVGATGYHRVHATDHYTHTLVDL